MATILNIETSSDVCSVAISHEGEIIYQLEDHESRNHAVSLAPFVEKCFNELARRELHLDAVAVSGGPGSYTGLRIGFSMAKGICFGKNLPLIILSTLEILAVKAMFRSFDWEDGDILVPMVDARRMEVYTCAYNFALNPQMTAGPLILDKDSYSDVAPGHRLFLFGDGSEKAKDLLEDKRINYLGNLKPFARDMIALAERAYRNSDFADLAYSVPQYLKEYQTTAPKSRI